MGQIYLGEEELKVHRIGHDAKMEQDAVHMGYEADVTAHLLDTNGTIIGVTGLLDTGSLDGRTGSLDDWTGSLDGRTGSLDELPGGREFG